MKNTLLKYWPILVITILSLVVIWPLFLPGYFSHHDDLQVMRIFEMKRCIEDLQVPCRWVPDMGYGNGYPLFNYYNPFPYYLGGIFSFALGFLTSAKILFLTPLLLGGFSMYFLAKEMFGKEAGLLAAVLYLFAPYRALDAYVRGAVAESFAIALVPLVLYFALKLVKEKKAELLIGLSISLAAFLASHTIMTLLFSPVIFFMIIYWIWQEKKGLYTVTIGVLLGIGLSAFFIIPAYFEKNLVQIDNLARLDLDFRAHFVTLSQLFLNRFWGYGASVPGPFDTISFQIGLPHWVLAFLSLPLVFIRQRKNKNILILYFGIMVVFLLSIFMTHNRSAFVWEKIGILRFTQFPWRFLAVIIFTAALLGAFSIYSLKEQAKKVLLFVLILITAVLNWNYFKPNVFMPDLTDQDKLSGKLWEIQQKASILDYLPIGAGEPIEPAPDKPIVKQGSAQTNYFKVKSNSWKLDLDVKSAAKIEIPVMDFPNWKVYDNNREIKHTNDNYVKRITINLPVGVHSVSGKFTNTPIRTVGNIVSFLSLLVILYLAIYGKNNKFFK